MNRTISILALAVVSLAGCGGNDAAKTYVSPPIDHAALVKTCAMAVSCLGVPQFSSGSACAAELELGIATGGGIFGATAADLTRLMSCATSSSDCTSVIDCFTQHHGSDYCSAHNEDSCDGDTLVSCINGVGLVQLDCTKSGMHCAAANGSASCSDGKSCDVSANGHCDGNRFVTCDGLTALESQLDCATFIRDGVCLDGIGCSPPLSGACASDACSSGTAGTVCSNGRQLPIDCSVLGETCAVGTSKESSPCVSASHDCDGSFDQCTSDGTGLQICVNGSWMTTTCSSIGLATCGPSGSNMISCR